MPKSTVFLDGILIPGKKSLVDSLAPGALSGRGVFETMRAYNGKVFALEDHLDRMFRGLKAFNIAPPLPKKEIASHVYRTLSLNRFKNSKVRMTVWRGPETARLSIVILPYRPYAPSAYTRGFKAVAADIAYDRKEVPSYVKSIDYLPLAAASKKARRTGHDEALILNRAGHIVEGSRTNLFFVKGGILCTPSLSSGCLQGITRQKILNLSRALGLRTKQVRARCEDVLNADEAFLTNSLVEVMPLTFLQGKKIGLGRMGPWTRKILNSYKKLVLRETS